jgi:hypothetical protein
MNDLGMMQIPVEPGSRRVLFRFEGIAAWHFWVALALGAIVIASAAFCLRQGRQ